MFVGRVAGAVAGVGVSRGSIVIRIDVSSVILGWRLPEGPENDLESISMGVGPSPLSVGAVFLFR